MKKEQKRFWSIVGLAFVGMLVWHLLPTLGKGVKALTPFLLAFATAYLLRHPTMGLEKLLKKICRGREHKWQHTASSVTVLVLFIGIVVFLVSLLIPSIIDNAADLLARLPDVLGNWEIQINDYFERTSEWLNIDMNSYVTDYISSITASILNYFKNLKLLNMATSALSSAASGIVSTVMYVIATFFLLHDYEKMKQWVKKLLLLLIPDNETYIQVCSILHTSDVTVEKYIVVKLTTSFCLGIVAFVGFSLFGLPYAVLLATVVAVTNIVPYLGPIVGAIPPILVGLSCGGFGLGLWVGVFILVCQQIEGNLVTPLLTGDALNISPLLVLMGIAVCGAMLGIPGMILGAPIAAIIASIARGAIKAKETEIKKNGIKQESDVG